MAAQPDRDLALKEAQQAYYDCTFAPSDDPAVQAEKVAIYDAAKDAALSVGIAVEDIEMPVDMDYQNANRWRIGAVVEKTRPLVDAVLTSQPSKSALEQVESKKKQGDAWALELSQILSKTNGFPNKMNLDQDLNFIRAKELKTKLEALREEGIVVQMPF